MPLDHQRIALTVRSGTSATKRAEVVHGEHKSLLHGVVPALIQEWERRIRVQVSGYILQRMKTMRGKLQLRR